MARERGKRELIVVFDTSALHTQVPGDLVNAATRDLIGGNSDYPDLEVTWCLPDVVALERQYQMLSTAEQLLRSFQKMDSILGYGISLKADQLAGKVDSAVDVQMAGLKLNRLKLDQSRVDWAQLIRNATMRVPPFQVGEKEKGFRDAVVVETFVQLAEDSPRVKSTRIVLVTGDDLMSKAAEQRIKGLGNTEVIRGLEDLRNLINTLVSQVDEATVKDLREKAGKLFFVAQNKKTLWYRKKVAEQIQERFAKELAALPEGATERENESVSIEVPRFVKKAANRVFWISPVTYVGSAYKSVDVPSMQIGNSYVVGTLDAPGSESVLTINPGVAVSNTGIFLGQPGARPFGVPPTYGTYQPSFGFARPAAGGYMSLLPGLEKVLVKKGSTEFNVEWSATLDRTQKLTRPQIDDIKRVGTTWE
jgi:hypothetical protein